MPIETVKCLSCGSTDLVEEGKFHRCQNCRRLFLITIVDNSHVLVLARDPNTSKTKETPVYQEPESGDVKAEEGEDVESESEETSHGNWLSSFLSGLYVAAGIAVFLFSPSPTLFLSFLTVVYLFLFGLLVINYNDQDHLTSSSFSDAVFVLSFLMAVILGCLVGFSIMGPALTSLTKPLAFLAGGAIGFFLAMLSAALGLVFNDTMP